jgi:hypothetical protein
MNAGLFKDFLNVSCHAFNTIIDDKSVTIWSVAHTLFLSKEGKQLA